MPEPFEITPRLLNRRRAAVYCGMSPTTLDACIHDGVFPGPVRIRGCVRWDRLKLDEAIDALASAEVEDGPAVNEWD